MGKNQQKHFSKKQPFVTLYNNIRIPHNNNNKTVIKFEMRTTIIYCH